MGKTSRSILGVRERFLGKLFPEVIVGVYLALTLVNFFSFLCDESVALSSGGYEAFLGRQVVINPVVRLLNEKIGFPGMILEDHALALFMAARDGERVGLLLYSVYEIAVLDFFAGLMFWYIFTYIFARRFRRFHHSQNASR